MIKFYSKSKNFYQFSNFYICKFNLDNLIWKTVEHYYQAQKFIGTPYFDTIKDSETPGKAKKLGRSKVYKIRSDWEEIKIDIMKNAVRAKFEQNDDLKKLLISTNDNILAEHSRGDNFWGIGSKEKGKNVLGKIIMSLRDEFIKP